MKKIFAIIFIASIFTSACSPSNQSVPSPRAPTDTATVVPPTPTATEIPPTSTSTATPTLSLPISLLTPVPSSNSRITAENVKDLQEIARYYGEITYSAKLTKDKKFLFILDPEGVTKYDYELIEPVAHVELANSGSDLQISDNGGWVLFSNGLLDLRNDKDPKVYDLPQKIDLLDSFYVFSLSPDGSMIAAVQGGKIQIVSTEDFKVLYTLPGGSYVYLPTFSPDGKYFSLVDLFIESHADGSSNPAGASLGIWSTSDFTKLSSFSLKFPFYATSMAFSADNSVIAVALGNFIDVLSVEDENLLATITDLCESPTRKVMFAPSLPLRLLEHSDCSSSQWKIVEGSAILVNDRVPDLSRMDFDEGGNPQEIAYPYPTTPNLRAYRQEIYFEFLNNNVLSFKSFDLETLDQHSCDLSLWTSLFACQSHAPERQEGRYVGKDVILATDGNYYGYDVGLRSVEIYPLENPSQIYYSIPFVEYDFDFLALDPINTLVIYSAALSPSINRIVIQETSNDRILENWEGETFLSSVVFSENGKFAALCRGIGYTNRPNKDRLVIFDLSEKRTVYNTEFTCSGAKLGISNDGSKLAVEHHYLKPNDELYSTSIMILNTTPPYEKEHFEFDSFLAPYAVAFSPSDSVLAVGCGGKEICFFDVATWSKIYQLSAHSHIADLAFSPDGSLLATSSDWGLISIWAVPPFEYNTRNAGPASPLSYVIPTSSWDFNNDGDLEGWGEEDWQYEGLSNLRVRNGYLSANVTGPNTRLNNDNEQLHIAASKFSQIEVRMRVSAGTYGVIYFTLADGDWVQDRSKYFELIPDNEFHTYVLNMSDVDAWAGFIEQLRIDPVGDGAGTQVDIDYIHVLPPNVSWDFDETGNLEGWGQEDWQIGGLKDVRVTSGNLSATATDPGPMLYSIEGLSIDASKFTRIEIRMRVSGGNSANLYFRHENDDMSEEMSAIFEVQPGTEFKTYILDLENIPSWKGMIYQLRLDPTHDASGATIDIDYVKLLP